MFLVTLTKKKGLPNENLVQDNLQKSELQPSLGDVTQTEATHKSETSHRHKQQAEAQSDFPFPLDCESSNIMDKNFELSAQKYEQQEADPQSYSSISSDNESSTGSIMVGSFEIDHIRNQNLDISDSLASDNDEDGLIEINLPSSHFCDLIEDPKQKLEAKLPESIFTELLAEINEMNEDENLIEIDISMGSTKYQDLRLKEELAHLGDNNRCVLSD
ncbi:hypothetical protein SESBI_21602 [Sesbania bispinosa]|nr:hypothetical protein SESBI_21602 [Sesbania bispinosa]